jgi:hypothetical protein
MLFEMWNLDGVRQFGSFHCLANTQSGKTYGDLPALVAISSQRAMRRGFEFTKRIPSTIRSEMSGKTRHSSSSWKVQKVDPSWQIIPGPWWKSWTTSGINCVSRSIRRIKCSLIWIQKEILNNFLLPDALVL